MKLQNKIKKNIQPKGIFNVNFIEKGAGLRNLKLYEFLKGTTNLTDSEALSVLNFVKDATKFQR
jgi:hypothetical protein